MGIEMLWLLPVLSLAVFGFVIMLRLQGIIGDGYTDETKKLTREVDEFNRGFSDTDVYIKPSKEMNENPDDKIRHNSVDSVCEVIEKQNSIINKKLDKEEAHDIEVNSVKQYLSNFRHEYDSVKTENYALKTQVKRLSEKNVDLRNKYKEMKQRLEELESGISKGRIVSISEFKDKRSKDSKERSGTD